MRQIRAEKMSHQDLSHILEGRFHILPEFGTFSVSFSISEVGKKVWIKTKIQIVHFLVVLNHATIGHKHQGKSLDALVIAQWSKTKNWAYVVISRVQTLAGLFLTSRIPEDIDFMPSADYLVSRVPPAGSAGHRRYTCIRIVLTIVMSRREQILYSPEPNECQKCPCHHGCK